MQGCHPNIPENENADNRNHADTVSVRSYYTTVHITKSQTHALSLKNAFFRDSIIGKGSKTKRNYEHNQS